MSKTLSITALENVSIGKLLLRFSAQKVLHLLDFLPCRRGYMASLLALAHNENKPVLHNLSVKNQRFLTAPLTQGSQGRSRASASLTLCTTEGLASPSGRGARRAERALSVSFADSSPKGGAQRVKKVDVIPRERSDRGNPYSKKFCFYRKRCCKRNILRNGLPRQCTHWLAMTGSLTVSAPPKGEPRALPRQCAKQQFFCLPRQADQYFIENATPVGIPAWQSLFLYPSSVSS